MSTTVFKGITIVGTSTESFSKAIEAAIERAGQTMRELRWFEVRDQRGAIRDGQIEYQVTLEVFFRLVAEEANDEPAEKPKQKKKKAKK
ncbi:MAG TPA: dodecin [Blastocatellia bacterium]|jgi:flavin-binding protein dodecin